jgi:predicted RND superfamily exporter protein
MDTLLAPVKKAYPGQTIRTTGIHVIGRDEMRTGTEDSFVSSLVAFGLILFLLIIAFRMKAAPLLAGTVLIVGIVWDMGLAGLFIGRLNMMTLFCTVYLIGLGVDFAVHFLQGFNEQRIKAGSLEQAVRDTFRVTGPGILTGGLTTTLAFLALTLTDFDLFKELGFISGVGVLMCVISAFTVLPALLVLRENRAVRKGKNIIPPPQVGRSMLLGRLGQYVSQRPFRTIALIILVTAVAAWFAINRTWFDSNFLNEEAKGLESIELQEEMVERFQLSQDNAVLTVPDLDSAFRITQYLQDRKIVGMVESPSLFCPPPGVQEKRRPYLEKILKQTETPRPAQHVDLAAFRAELERLEANIIEMGQTAYMSVLDRIVRRADRITGLDSTGTRVAPGAFSPVFDLLEKTDPAVLEKRLSQYQAWFSAYSRGLVRRMANPAAVTWDMVPEEWAASLVSKDGKEFLVSVFPKHNTWDDLMNSPFLKLLQGYVPHATGMTPLMEVLYRRGRQEGKMALTYAIIAIFCLLLLDFRSLKYTLLTMTPLAFAAVWLAGGYGLFGAPFTLMNVMALPLILGIGIDDGVPICHRFRREKGKGLGEVLSSVGRAVFLTTATTMLAFGSLAGSHMQGNVRMGLILFFGVGLCFVMSVTLLPALFGLIGGKR